MPTNDPSPALPPKELPLVEVWLDVGESLRLGNSVLRVLDTDGEDTMLRVDPATPEDEDDTRWSELPR
jgi:hypothetical protein